MTTDHDADAKPGERYRDRGRKLAEEQASLTAASRRISLLRSSAFLAAVALWAAADLTPWRPTGPRPRT